MKGLSLGDGPQGSEEAVEQLILVVREQFSTDFPGENFDAYTWDVRRFHTHATVSNQKLYFTHNGTCDEALPHYYVEVIKCWVVLERRSVTQMEQKTRAARLLWDAILERRNRPPLAFQWANLCVEDFYQAELSVLGVWAESSIYLITRYLKRLGEFLSARGICQHLYLAFQMPHVASFSRFIVADVEARRAKLPSQRALQGLADIFSRHAIAPPDRILIAALAVLIVTGFRIGELLTLPLDCEVEEERRGASRYGLRYYKEKSPGGAKMLAVRWLTAVGAELAKQAIEEIRTITVPFRQRAIILEQNPNRVPLPGFNWSDRIRPKKLASVLGLASSSSIRQVPQEKLLCHLDDDGPYYLASEVEAYLFSQRVEHLWTLDRRDGTYQKLSETLLIAPRLFFRPTHGTSPLLVEPINYGHFAHFLANRQAHTGSAFERFGIREEDGSFCKMTSHQFRHWLNDIADKGGLSVELQTRWLGRDDARDTEAYRHATMDERLQWVKNGICGGQIGGKLADVYFQLPKDERDVFLEGQVQAVHFTALGLCLHDYSIEPCPFHLNCMLRCRDYLRIKGNQEERKNLI